MGSLSSPEDTNLGVTSNEMIRSLEQKVQKLGLKTNFFSLPLEVRQIIYDEIFKVWKPGGIFSWGDFGLYDRCAHNIWPDHALSLVCRQMHYDVAPYIYKEVYVTNPIDHWERFFREVGPHNISHIQEITIVYSCNYMGLGCFGHEEYKDPYGKWDVLFSCLAQAQFKPKLARIFVKSCQDILPNNRCCQVYEDPWFFKGLYSSLRHARKIELFDSFNPLWGFALRHAFNFVLRYPIAEPNRMTLFNPEFIIPKIDLKDSTESRKNIYRELKRSTVWVNDDGW
ncbi:hypothetical protein F5Y11DRAFT_345296 [Daldinia sp. FL1419]|nr:hypothetical protein F5Y11DRAFT_345296 [Daldinia sp. FL1419]